MLEDINLQKIIVKRTSKVAIGRSLVSVSVTGGVDYEDILDENPIFKTVKREVKEELGINISDKNITFEGIFIGPTKLQPIAICSVKINDNFQNLNFYGKDRKFEVEKITIVNDNDLKKYLKYPMTEASRFQIKRIIDKLTKWFVIKFLVEITNIKLMKLKDFTEKEQEMIRLGLSTSEIPEKEREELRKIITEIFQEKMDKHKIK